MTETLFQIVLCSGILLFPLPVSSSNASPAQPGPIRTYSTIYSIGIEWDITGDANHNATCAIQYRKQGDGALRDFVGLFRVDFRGWYDADSADRTYNMLAGSVMFLDPATTYEIKLALRDSDGGNKDTNCIIATRSLPSLPTGGKTIHVTSGNGGGDGSPANPYKGLAAAQTGASAGDIVLVHAGNYGSFSFSKSGAADAYIVWKSAGDGDAVLDYGRIIGHHIWLDGLIFINSGGQTYALVGQNGSPSNVIQRCGFTGFNYGITLQANSNDWYIADNTIVGDKTNPRVEGDFEGEGVELEHTSGHTVCYNNISRVADGVSYALRNCDIFNNDIFDVTDDGVEPDYGYANIRVWQNRITNARNHGFSFQPMYCGPWYFIRNQVVGVGCYMLKYRVVDRFLLAHNTFVGWNTLDIFDQNILSALSRNNLWIQAGGSGYIWEAMPCAETGSCTQPERWAPDWRTSVDYDGFDWGASSPVFKWGDPVQRYTDLAGFVTVSGIETHGIHLNKAELFDSLNDPGSDSLYDRRCLILKPGCAAIDKGDKIAGINDDFSGSGPDLGAYEFGKPLPHYGPRTETGNGIAVSRNTTKIPAAIQVISSSMDHRVIFRIVGGRGPITLCIYTMAGKQIAQIHDDADISFTRILTWSHRFAGVYCARIMQKGGGSMQKFLVR